MAVGERMIDTGFYKESVVGPVNVGSTGIIGDHVADLSRHGGEDQALYLFSNEDCRWWTTQLGQDVGAGYFGENITIDGWWSQPRIGDRIHFSNLAIEISFPRIPCATLAARVGNARFLKSFLTASRPGLYARVLRAGSIAPGDVGQVEAAPSTNPTAESMFALWHKVPRDPDRLKLALAAPIARRARTVIEAWLAQSDA